MRIKQIDVLLIKSFIPPFLLSLLIALFVLLMQSLWQMIDEIMGKGVGAFVILELVGYLCVALFPLALPMAVLISSVMVFGNMAEKYELSSMKSAGVSLMRILFPLFLVSIAIAGFSFYCSNNLIPVANLKAKSRIYDIQRQKPALAMGEQTFNDDFAGYTIRFGAKDEDGEHIEDVMIYDHSKEHFGLLNLTKAKKGRMYVDENNTNFILHLDEGHQYQELESQPNERFPFIKTSFKSFEIPFDLTQFEMGRTDESQYKDRYDMLTAGQLRTAIDTINVRRAKLDKEKNEVFLPQFMSIKSTNKSIGKKKGFRAQGDKLFDMNYTFAETFSSKSIDKLTKKARQSVGRMTSALTRRLENEKRINIRWAKNVYELHIKFSRALVCIIFLFIGGSMGAIIRKGGYGFPLLVSIMFFMLFMVLSLSFHETMKIGGMNPIVAAWLPNAILFPVALLLTIKAQNDSKVFDFERIALFFRKLFNRVE